MSSIYKKLLEGYPRKIAKDILADFAEPNINASQRWIWELLQNAKDCSFPKGVDIKIKLTPEYIEFSHNGKPFNQNDLISLLTKDSSKTPNFSDDDKFSFFKKAIISEELTEQEIEEYLNKTGKFGTGFMTTYLLSYNIELETIYADDKKNYSKLEINLDREADNLFDMEKKVNASFEVLDVIENLNSSDYIIGFEERKYFTKFKYKFNGKESAHRIALKGINNLQNSVYYTLAFVDSIKSIEIDNDGQITSYEKKSDNLREGINIIEILENEKSVKIVVASSKNNIVQVAIPISVQENGTISLEFIDDNISTQFLSFPLISDIKFDFPVIINSPLFNPTEPRDSLIIQSNEDLQENDIAIKKAKLNKSIYEQGVELYLSILSHGIEKDWKNIELLAKTNTPKNVDKEWFRDIQRKIRTTILESEIVKPSKGNKNIKPINTLFPIYEIEAEYKHFWELCNEFISEKIPILSQSYTWQNIIHPNKNEYKNWNAEIKFDIEDLLNIIQGENLKLENTIAFLFNNQRITACSALIKVIGFIESNKLDLLIKPENYFCIIPNYYGDYKKKDTLFKNENIPMKLIECSEHFGKEYDYNRILVKEEFKEAFISDNKRTLVQFSNSIRLAIENGKKITTSNEKEQFLNAILILNSYSSSENEQKQTQLHKIASYFFTMYREKNKEVIIIDNALDFDWSFANQVLIDEILSNFKNSNNLEGISNLNDFSERLFHRPYSIEGDSEIDYCINEIIEFIECYYVELLDKYAIIPNQNNNLLSYHDEIYNDVFDKDNYNMEENKNNYNSQKIPSELKMILVDFGKEFDFKNKLRHHGVNIILKKTLDISDICKKLDETVMELRDNTEPDIKQNIRKLDNWISKKSQMQKTDFWNNKRLEDYFPKFFKLRAGIAYNTLTIEEKEKSGNIIYSGYLNELSQITEVIKKQDDKDRKPLIEVIMKSLEKEDEKIQNAKFYRNLGKTVENIFQSITGSNAKVEDNGQDFLLLNSLLEIGIRLEIKSRSRKGDYVLMTKAQAKNAVICTEEYVLCVFPDVSDSTPENFKQKARFILDIKFLLSEKYYETEEFFLDKTINENQNILLEFENQTYKYKINKSIWEHQNNKNVLNFEEFESYIKGKIG